MQRQDIDLNCEERGGECGGRFVFLKTRAEQTPKYHRPCLYEDIDVIFHMKNMRILTYEQSYNAEIFCAN